MKQPKHKNEKKINFLQSIPTDSIEESDLPLRSKFNFSYFDGTQEAGSNFDKLEQAFLVDLLEKLKAYSREPLQYWLNRRAGGGGLKVLEIYKKFPAKSDFKHPKNIPHDVEWARFRMDNLTRLVGFIVPSNMNNKPSKNPNFLFCANTFYVVFVDKDHRFYITEER